MRPKLDFYVQFTTDKETLEGLNILADKEAEGNRSLYIRQLIRQAMKEMRRENEQGATEG